MLNTDFTLLPRFMDAVGSTASGQAYMQTPLSFRSYYTDRCVHGRICGLDCFSDLE